MAIRWTAGNDTTRDYSTTPWTDVPKPTYDGAVLGTTGRDVRIMSDVWAWMTYARVWDGTKVTDVPVACSEYPGAYGVVTVDATPDVLALVDAAAKVAAAEVARLAEVARIDRLVAYAKKVDFGKDVTVVKGRKVAKGTTGRVFWFGDTRFGSRVGLELVDGSRVFTATSNVEVSNPDEYLDYDAVGLAA